MVTISQALLYYKRKDIQRAIAKHAEDREISGCFDLKGFSKRPDMIQYPTEILEMVKRRITSFHCSEELWYNPLQLNSNLTRKELDKLRKGWDLLLDIDCKELEFSKLAAHYLVEALKHHNITAIYTKFSGNHGFHIAVPFEAFPEKVHGKEVKHLFPEAPRRIAAYLQNLIEPHLRKHLLENYTIPEIAKLSGKSESEITKNNILQPFTFLDVDTVLIASRHMYRMPYSFNEKSGLISIPIKPENILTFEKPQAKPEKIKVTNIPFIERNIQKHQAAELFVEAFDFKLKLPQLKQKKKVNFEEITEATPEDLFPPCIHNILKGLEDGKKRAVFILINFLTSVGWNKQQITEKLGTWNQHNPTSLKEVYIKGQLNSLKYKLKTPLPPNCSNISYYKDCNICTPDNLCNKIKNPVNYTRRKIFAIKNANAPKNKREKLTEDQKAMRRAHRERLKAQQEVQKQQ